ncbi:ABC transporter permease [Janibacter limosus]|uniref:ABC transporter permease n=1 Tax=Janibacter limosus TaxID=53458 RepID=UPI000830593F|nr:ABC transporter permease [Janibacter limosus]
MARRRSVELSTFAPKFGLIGVWLCVGAAFSVLRPERFLTWSNVQTIFGSQTVILFLALALCVALSAGEVDLSITGVLGVSSVLGGFLNVELGWPIVPTIMVMLLCGALIGALNAVFVVGLGINAMVVTLGSGTFFGGIAVAINQETAFGISDGLVSAMRAQVIGLPLAFWYGVALTAILWWVFRYTIVGTHLRFVGSNHNASRLSGVPVDRLRTGSLIITSTLAATAGVVMIGTLGSVNPAMSPPYLLPAFAAAFLGSTAINPGRFNSVGTFVAVYFLTTGITGIQLIGASGWAANVFYGGALVLAVAASQVVGRFKRKADIQDLIDDATTESTSHHDAALDSMSAKSVRL